jgi:hypothetical protein
LAEGKPKFQPLEVWLVGRKYDDRILSDGQAEDALRDWPLRPSEAWGWAAADGCSDWLRLVPWNPHVDKSNLPNLVVVGMESASTEPDGLWASLGPAASFVDVVVVEHCGTRQNFYDKRSRYMPALCTRQLRFPAACYTQSTTVQGGALRTLLQLCDRLPQNLNAETRIPVRHVHVLYALNADDYDDFHETPFAAHEFFCPHAALAQPTSPQLRDFVRGLSIARHWYADPR